MSLLPSRNIATALLLLVAVAAMAPGIEPSAPPLPVKTAAQSSTSATGQFTIHGMDLATRGAFCLMCDDVAAALGRLLRDDAHFALPVVVVLKPPGDATSNGPAVTWNISQLTHGGFHLQVNATLRSDFRGDDFAREVVRVLLAERILRNHKELKTSRQNVLPNWVLTGIANAMEFRGRSRPSLLFAAVFRSGQIYSVDKILSADPSRLDALARGIYETSACALVLALLDQPDGPLRFAKFLDSLARNDKSDRDLLRQMFPSMGASKNSLEKWWSLQMATLATPSPLESLGAYETEARLRDALTLVLDPLPDKEKKKKAVAPEAPPKEKEVKPATDEGKKDEKRRFFFFGRPTSSTDVPAMGGKKILFVPVSDADTDGSCADTEKKPADAPAPAEKSGTGNAANKESAAKSKAAAKEAPKKPEAKPEATQDEKNEPEKRSMLNPRNWFRKKDKPAEEATKNETETPKKEAAPPKDNPPAAKKVPPRDAPPPTPAPRQIAPPAAPNPRETRPQGIPIEEFSTVWKRDDRDKIFQQSIARLNALKVQAHPLYRPLIGDYIATIRLLVNGKQKGVAEKLTSLREQLSNISKLARAVESHLDWYEASQTRSYSGAFDDYLKLCDQIDREYRSRNDALSKYLDLLQKEYN